jgi:hypothetical protein
LPSDAEASKNGDDDGKGCGCGCAVGCFFIAFFAFSAVAAILNPKTNSPVPLVIACFCTYIGWKIGVAIAKSNKK